MPDNQNIEILITLCVIPCIAANLRRRLTERDLCCQKMPFPVKCSTLRCDKIPYQQVKLLTKFLLECGRSEENGCFQLHAKCNACCNFKTYMEQACRLCTNYICLVCLRIDRDQDQDGAKVIKSTMMIAGEKVNALGFLRVIPRVAMIPSAPFVLHAAIFLLLTFLTISLMKTMLSRLWDTEDPKRLSFTTWKTSVVRCVGAASHSGTSDFSCNTLRC